MRRFVQAFDGEDLLPSSMPAPLAQALASLPPRYNISARTPAAVLYAHDGLLRAGEFTWGLVPKWSKEPRTKYTTVTARLEATIGTMRDVHDAVDEEDPTSADVLHAVIEGLEQFAWMVSAENRTPAKSTK